MSAALAGFGTQEQLVEVSGVVPCRAVSGRRSRANRASRSARVGFQGLGASGCDLQGFLLASGKSSVTPSRVR